MRVFAPSIGDEPDQGHEQKQVQHPQSVDPIVAPPFPGLEQVSETTNISGHTQTGNDRRQNDDVAEGVHTRGRYFN